MAALFDSRQPRPWTSSEISNPAAGQMNILQQGNKAIVNWNSFSIGNNELSALGFYQLSGPETRSSEPFGQLTRGLVELSP